MNSTPVDNLRAQLEAERTTSSELRALVNGRDRTIAELNEKLAALTEAPHLTKAAHDVLSERARQVLVEGWTPEHDDAHIIGELPDAAVAYALTAAGYGEMGHSQFWPFAESWWKPKDARRDFVRAAALLIAEIERLDRKP